MLGLPNDEEILAALARRGSSALTADIHLALADVGFSVRRTWVSLRLKRLEKAGRIKRVPTGYATQIRWALTGG